MGRSAQSGFSKLELATVLIICSILIVVYLRSVRHYQEMIEHSTVYMTLASIRTGMAHEWAERITKGRIDEPVEDLLGANPVRWLETLPPFYFGEVRNIQSASLQTGAWYFDAANKEFLYVVGVGENLEVERLDGKKILRWKVVVDENSKSKVPVFGDLALVSVNKYRWF